MSQIPERLLPAFSVVIYPPSYQPPHFFLSKNPVVRFIDGPAKPFARALHKLDEVSVLELHAASSPIGGKITKPNVPFPPIADISSGGDAGGMDDEDRPPWRLEEHLRYGQEA